MEEKYRLSLIFCAVNESDLLEAAFSKTYFNNEITECIFILSKNHSKDCLSTVKKLCMNSNCKYIIQSGKGLGNAIQEAFRESNGTHIVIWPADDGMDSSVFPQMIETSKNNPQKIIKISRWLRKGDFVNYNVIRKYINYSSQKIFSVLFHSNLTDYTNPTQIAPVNVYRKIKWDSDGYDFIPEMIFKPLKLGVEIIEISCTDTEKRSEKSNIGFFSLAKYYVAVLKIRFKSKQSILKKGKNDI